MFYAKTIKEAKRELDSLRRQIGLHRELIYDHERQINKLKRKIECKAYLE